MSAGPGGVRPGRSRARRARRRRCAARDGGGCRRRDPVQYVIRTPVATGHRRRYAGQLASGTLRVGETVTVLPGGRRSTISAIDVLGRSTELARAPQSVALCLADDLDVSRGDLIAPIAAAPATTTELQATVCHLHDRPLRPGDRLLLKHTTRTVRALVEQVTSRLDVATRTHEDNPGELRTNDIGIVRLRTAEPLALGSYARSRRTGSFLLIDPLDGATLAAGMAGPAGRSD